jgi:hypothetical protein
MRFGAPGKQQASRFVGLGFFTLQKPLPRLSMAWPSVAAA